MPFAIFDYMGAFLRSGFAHVDNVNCYPRDQSNHMAAPVNVARQQTTPELSGTFRALPPEPTPTHPNSREPSETRLATPAHTGTFRNFPEPSKTFRNLLNLRQHTTEPSEIFRNRPELASGTDTIL